MQKTGETVRICCLLHAVITRLTQLAAKENFEDSRWRQKITSSFAKEITKYRASSTAKTLDLTGRNIWHYIFRWDPANSPKYMLEVLVPTEDYSFSALEMKIPSSHHKLQSKVFRGINLTRMLNINEALRRMGYCSRSPAPTASNQDEWYLGLRDAYEEIGAQISRCAITHNRPKTVVDKKDLRYYFRDCSICKRRSTANPDVAGNG